MRGTKAKALRREASRMVQQAGVPPRIRTHAGQAVTGNVRYVYQAMKGRRMLKIEILTPTPYRGGDRPWNS